MVHVLILNYNGGEDSIECVESLLESSFKDLNIVIIDNYSNDNSVELIKEYLVQSFIEINEVQYKNGANEFINIKHTNILTTTITLLYSDENNGYASGNNIGLSYLLLNANKKDFIWILNNDVTVKKDTLQHLYNSYNKLIPQNIGILGAKIMNYDNPDIIQSLGSLKQSQQNALLQEYIEVEHVSGCSIFFQLDLIKKVGYLPEEYFLYYEETDWMKTIKLKDLKIFTSINAIVLHKHAKSTGGIYSPFVIYYMTRNRFLYNKKYMTKFQYLLFLSFILPFNLLKSIRYFFINSDISSSILKGSIDGIKGISGKVLKS